MRRFRVGDRRTFHERKAIRLSSESGEATEADGGRSAGESGASDPNGSDGPTALAQAREAVADGGSGINANGKRVAVDRDVRDESLGPDLDLGADFDLDEEELALLEGREPQTAGSNDGGTATTAPLEASGAEAQAQRELEVGTGVPEEEADAELDDMLGDFGDEELTAEEREELKRALLLSQSEPDGM